MHAFRGGPRLRPANPALVTRKWTQERLGDALPALLEKESMSSRALARAIGVDQAHISRVINGHLPASGELAARVAEELGLPTDYFPDYRESAVIEAIRDDPGLRDRIYRSLGRKRQGAKRQ